MPALQQSREVTRESFLQPQPVGLTNTQCQILGPYFTRNPTHCHPEALRDPSKEQHARGLCSIPYKIVVSVRVEVGRGGGHGGKHLS